MYLCMYIYMLNVIHICVLGTAALHVKSSSEPNVIKSLGGKSITSSKKI